jgi:hypothetical protein
VGACFGAADVPTVATGDWVVPAAAVLVWLVGLQAESAKTSNSNRNKILRGIRFSFQGIFPNFTSETVDYNQTFFRNLGGFSA